jgi:hypothetical protein
VAKADITTVQEIERKYEAIARPTVVSAHTGVAVNRTIAERWPI